MSFELDATTNIPQFTIRDLLEAGVHFGHRTMRWNPRMEPFIYGERNNIHILDLQQTAPMLRSALMAVNEVARKGGRILFVGTKPQASDMIRDAAVAAGQYYVNHRWLGGMLTNWQTVSKSIKTIDDYESSLNDPEIQLSKKERLNRQRMKEKLEKSLGGIRTMGRVPHLLFVIDTNREHLAIEESRKLGIPTIAIVDSNSNPDGITYPVPGNDDATRAIQLYCDLISKAALAGKQARVANTEEDAGESTEVPSESLPEAKDKKEGKESKIAVEVKASKSKRAKTADVSAEAAPADEAAEGASAAVA